MTGDSNTRQAVLVIGATGMLGRPVVRRLVQEGFDVRAMVRDEGRGRTLLPTSVTLIGGDLRDERSVMAAMAGIELVYVNLAQLMTRRRPAWDPDTDGSLTVLRAAERAGIRRLARISALGATEAADDWWVAREKDQTDRMWIESDVDSTILRPTWFMESLSTLRLGRRIMVIGRPDLRLRWLAGDDYGRQVAAALRAPEAANRIYTCHGPDLVTFGDAARRYAAALSPRYRTLNVPLWPFRSLTSVNGRMHYLVRLMDMTEHCFAHLDEVASDGGLPPATMTIEDYARYMQLTGDEPRK